MPRNGLTLTGQHEQQLEGDEMSRRVVTVVAAGCAMFALAACTSSGGDGPSSTPTTSQSSPTSSAPTSASVPTSARPRPAPTPTGFGAAQPAVDAYVAYQNLANEGLAAPDTFDAAAAARYSAGQAKQVLTYAIADELKQGKAYRGTPWGVRVKIKSASVDGSLPSVVMTDCPATNRSWTEYVVKTGTVVPMATAKVPPPYLATIKAFQPNRKTWVITSYTLDGSKTCSA